MVTQTKTSLPSASYASKPLIVNVKIENNLNSKNPECCDEQSQERKKTAGLRLPPNKNQLSYGHGMRVISDPFGSINFNEIRRIDDQGRAMYQTLSRDMQNYYQDVQRQQTNFNQMLNNLINQPAIASIPAMPATPQQTAAVPAAGTLPTPQTLQFGSTLPSGASTGSAVTQQYQPAYQAFPPPTPAPAATTPPAPTPAATTQPQPQTPPTSPPPASPRATILQNQQLPQNFSQFYSTLNNPNDRGVYDRFIRSFNGDRKNATQKRTLDRFGDRMYKLLEIALDQNLIRNPDTKLYYTSLLNDYLNSQAMAAGAP